MISQEFHYLITKLLYAIGGLFGGLTIGMFWRPAQLRDRGPLAAGVIIGGLSAGASVAFGGLIAQALGLDAKGADVAMAVGTSVGLVALGVVGWLAVFFGKREKKDILEVISEVKGAAK